MSIAAYVAVPLLLVGLVEPHRDEESIVTTHAMTAVAPAGPSPDVEPAPIRVLIADDHPLFRRGIRMSLERHPEIDRRR